MPDETAVISPSQEKLIDDLRRGRLPAGQDPAKRSQIIDGARRVFIDMGFDAASMNDITRAAGVSKGTIYVYFANKEELFEALIEEERCAIFDDLHLALEQGGELRDTLIRYGIALVTKIMSEKVVRAQRTVIGISDRIPELGARFYERGPKQGHRKLAEFLRQAAPGAGLAIPDYETAAYQYSDLCFAGLFRQRIFGYRTEPPSAEEIRKAVTSGVDLFMRGYAAEAAAGSSG